MENTATNTTVLVEKCTPDFFYENINKSYKLFKNPRGQCLIINIYQIDGMPPRRWSDRDTDALRQLFEQLMFTVSIFTDSTHDLTSNNLIKILKDFSKSSKHDEAQCCVVCLMSHGEEGYLTTKEGNRLLLDDIFTMFNNINCPLLAGKPKIFLIQSCRDDPINGPAEDLGIIFSLKTKQLNELPKNDNDTHETDGNQSNTNMYHIPSLCDMVIGLPTQKGFIAYRKPEIGSWYMNAIVRVFSKHAKNTDICAMLNMVNALISNEVTNTGKKQMSEYTSKLTKPYLFFYPGLSIDFDFELNTKKIELNLLMNNRCIKRKRPVDNSDSLMLSLNTSIPNSNLSYKDILTHKHKLEIAKRARNYWKEIGRELEVGEVNIKELEETNDDLSNKLYKIIDIWICKIGHSRATFTKLIDILTQCNLNSIKQELLNELNENLTILNDDL